MFELNEGDTLSTTCLVYGNPTPFIQCSLVNKLDEVVNGAMTKKKQRNFTNIYGRILQFHNVHRTAYRIKCVMDGGPAARRTVEFRDIIVDCKCLFL